MNRFKSNILLTLRLISKVFRGIKVLISGLYLSRRMKRLLFIFLSFSIFLSAFSEGKNFSKWSISAEGGINKFDGDVTQAQTNIFPTSYADITFNVNLEYALTPIWGLSVDYSYFPISARTNPGIDIATKLNTYDINATINFTRMIFPQSRSRFYVNGYLGIGYSDYKYNTTPVSYLLAPGYGVAVTVPVAFSLEYNFSRSMAIGTKVQYRAFTKDNLEGVNLYTNDPQTHGVTNDFIGSGTLFLRYKFNSKKKSHLRNLTMEDFAPNEALVLARQNAGKISRLDKSLQNLEKKVDNQGRRLDSLVVYLSNDGTDTDGDGVPDHRDLDMNTPPNTAVDFWGRPLVISGNNGLNGTNGNSTTTIVYDESTPAVYFDFDQANLDDDALIVISKIAAKMKADPTLYVEVRGYCDYLGNNPYNDKLSKRRADRVKAELVKIWHIPADHIISNGKGKILEPRIQYRPNRRCDFFFDKQ